MNLDRPASRALLVLALGLAASRGLSVVLEAFDLPPALIRLAVLLAFLSTIGLAVSAAVARRSVNPAERERIESYERLMDAVAASDQPAKRD